MTSGNNHKIQISVLLNPAPTWLKLPLNILVSQLQLENVRISQHVQPSAGPIDHILCWLQPDIMMFHFAWEDQMYWE